MFFGNFRWNCFFYWYDNWFWYFCDIEMGVVLCWFSWYVFGDVGFLWGDFFIWSIVLL